MISAIVFIFWPEEENYLETCLETVSWVDEIIIIDNGATEKTVAIAKKYTDKIYKTADTSFAGRHNLGTEKAKGDWLLFIDADERVGKKLAEEIRSTLTDPKFDAYQLFRLNYFLGKKVRFGDRYPDNVTRLFKKDSLNNWTGVIHESSQVTGLIGQLKSPLYHLTHRDIFSMLEKTINFAEHEANLRAQAHHPPVVWWRLVRVFLTEFYTRIINYQGFRQGTEGWIDGIYQAFSLFVVYARLWEKQRNVSLSDTYREIDKKIVQGDL